MDELRQMLDYAGNLEKLFNTSGQDYRALGRFVEPVFQFIGT